MASTAVMTMEPTGLRRLRVARWNAGAAAGATPLLIFSGIGINLELLEPLAEALAERPVIAFDMPGVGQSPDPIIPYTIPSIALETAALLDRLSLSEVDVLGISWGGAVAQQFAFQHRARVRRLALAATSAGVTMAPGNLAMLKHLLDPSEYTIKRMLRRNLAMLYHGGGSDRPISLNAVTPPSPAGIVAQLAAFAGWSSLAFLPLLSLPVLVAAGDDDHVVPAANATLLAQLIPGSRLVTFPRGGHLFMLSQRERFATVLREFLDEDRRAAA